MKLFFGFHTDQKFIPFIWLYFVSNIVSWWCLDTINQNMTTNLHQCSYHKILGKDINPVCSLFLTISIHMISIFLSLYYFLIKTIKHLQQISTCFHTRHYQWSTYNHLVVIFSHMKLCMLLILIERSFHAYFPLCQLFFFMMCWYKQ